MIWHLCARHMPHDKTAVVVQLLQLLWHEFAVYEKAFFKRCTSSKTTLLHLVLPPLLPAVKVNESLVLLVLLTKQLFFIYFFLLFCCLPCQRHFEKIITKNLLFLQNYHVFLFYVSIFTFYFSLQAVQTFTHTHICMYLYAVELTS